MANLVIVESPAKAKTITKYLNSNKELTSKYGSFVVASSYGHIRDLLKGQLGIDISKNFTPTYQITEEKKKTVAELQSKAAQAKMVWLASDYDREGEGIAAHLKEVLKLKNNYKRITFTEITPRALEQAVLNPRLIDDNLVDSQETRRLLDRIVGFKLSPLLWKRYRTENAVGLSAGRVQSAVMHIILQRESEINAFDSGSYWYYLGDFTLEIKQGNTKRIPLTEAKLYKGGTVLKESSEQSARKLLKSIKNVFKVIDVKNKESKKNADLPFITSSLQQEAHSKHGFTLKRTMQLAQELYEKGHITYMRTDSYNISEDFQAEAGTYIRDTYGDAYWNPGGSKKGRKKQKNAQEAHEAIRPTHVQTLADALSEFSADHRKLYDMIWKRTVAFFMPACIYDEIEVKYSDKSFDSDMWFLSTFSRIKFNGYMIVYGAKNDTKDEATFANYMSCLTSASKHSITCNEVYAKNTWNSPPARYNESSIIKVLESEGIGRPSTYAGIMNKLFDKKYIIKTDVKGIDKSTKSFKYIAKNGSITEELGQISIGAERSRIVPTDIGAEIDKFLGEHFSYIVDKQFTANMEADLDRIAEGDKSKLDMLTSFWKVFGKDVSTMEGIKEKKVVLKTESLSLSIDGQQYIIRHAKYGPVIEYTGKDDKKVFVNLKPYLKMMKKELSDIDETDVRMLLSYPQKIATIDKKDFVFVYGPYGFYGKWNGENIRLPQRTVWAVLKQEDFVHALKSSIEYHKTKEDSNSKVDAPKKKIMHLKKK